MGAAPVTVGRPRAVTLTTRQACTAAAGLITIGAGALRLGFAFKSVTPNPFYDAAVRSMSLSWHNFFFGAFEPGGAVSIDKAPADLWFQVLSVKLLGFSSTALRLPEALAATAAVPLLYALVSRLFGRTAGLASAAALAVLPVAVVTARSDTMDSLMMALLVLAALLAVRSAQTGRAPLAAGAVLGLAFNVKLFEAMVPVPAIAVLFLLASEGPVSVRAKRLAKGAVVFVAAALSWVTAAGLVPPGSRPYPIGSSNGGVWNVLFAFNGINRLSSPPTAAAAALDPAGAGRLFGAHDPFYGSLIGTELLAALVLGGLALLASAALSRRRGPRLRVAGAAGIGLWLVMGAALFSTMGRLHPRYLEALSPAVAAAAGTGVAALGALAARHRAAAAALAAGTAAVILIGSGFARAQAPTHEIALIAGAVLVAACVALTLTHARPCPPWAAPLLTALAVAGLLAMPLGTSAHLAAAGATDSGRPGYVPPAQTAALSRFLTAHTRGLRYEAVSSTAIKAGPLIARDGRPVLVLTTPYGRQLTGAGTLARAVRSGQARYALLGPTKCPSCIPSLRWARAHGTDIGRSAGVPRGLLYRLSTQPVGHR